MAIKKNPGINDSEKRLLQNDRDKLKKIVR